MRPGAVIEFKDKKGILLAVCKRQEGSASLRLVTEGGKEFSYPADKVAHVTSHVIDPTLSEPAIREKLVAIRGQVEELTGQIDLSDLWEFYSSAESEGIELEEMTGTYFGAAATSDHRSAMLRALHDDPLYFKKKGELYVPKAADAVAETRRQIHEAQRRQKEREAALVWIRAARAGQSIERPEGLERHLELLRGLAVYREEFDGYPEASGLLRELGEEVPDGAFGLLVQIGVFQPDENLVLVKERIPAEFTTLQVVEASRIAQAFAELAARESALAVPRDAEVAVVEGGLRRLDLRHLEIVSIDDPETREIDDAVSLERIPGGFRIGVHIADVSAQLPKESLLDHEALRRATTIYMPDRTIPMLPEPVSHVAASLVAGSDRLALSLLADLDEQGAVRSYRFAPSVILVRRAVSYEDATLLCDDPESPLCALADLTRRFREERVKRGARVFERAELKIRVGPEGEISIKKRQGESLSDIIVSELMIFANQLAGGFCAEQGVPAVYRVQAPPQEEIGSGGNVSRRFLTMVKRIQVQTSPGGHWGLGLTSYAQMTSPIRRYLDLAVHRQIKRALGALEEGYAEDELREVIAATESAVEAAHNVQRWSNRYWLLKYLSSRVGETTPAVIQELRDESYLVNLTDYLIDIPFYPPPGRKYQVGDMLTVKVKTVDARRGILKVQESR